MNRVSVFFIGILFLFITSCQKEEKMDYRKIHFTSLIECHGGASPSGDVYDIPHAWAYIPKMNAGAFCISFSEDEMDFWQKPLKITIETLDDLRIMIYDPCNGISDHITNVPSDNILCSQSIKLYDSQERSPIPWVIEDRYFIILYVYAIQPESVESKTNKFRFIIEELETGRKYYTQDFMTTVSDITYRVEKYDGSVVDFPGLWYDLSELKQVANL